MNEEILSRIDALAAKLGVAGAHLWEVLVRQVYVGAVQSLVFAVVMVVVAGYFVRWFRAIERTSYGAFQNDEDVPIAIIGGIVVGTGFILAMVGVGGAIGMLINPEYYALKEILNTVAR